MRRVAETGLSIYHGGWGEWTKRKSPRYSEKTKERNDSGESKYVASQGRSSCCLHEALRRSLFATPWRMSDGRSTRTGGIICPGAPELVNNLCPYIAGWHSVSEPLLGRNLAASKNQTALIGQSVINAPHFHINKTNQLGAPSEPVEYCPLRQSGEFWREFGVSRGVLWGYQPGLGPANISLKKMTISELPRAHTWPYIYIYFVRIRKNSKKAHSVHVKNAT